MKNILHSLSLFCLALLLSNIHASLLTKNEMVSELGITEKCMAGSTLTQNELATFWGNLFSVNRGQACASSVMKAKAITRIAASRLSTSKRGQRAGGLKFAWIEKWGYDESSYLFDFFDPLFKNDITDAFKKLYDDAFALPSADTKEYQDSLDIKKLVSPDNKHLGKKINLKEFNKNYDPAIHSVSVNAVQLHSAMKTWNWFADSTQQDFAVDFIRAYDINGDGRLSPRELVLGSIMHNRNAIGSGICTNCFQEVAKKLDALFIYLDCDNDGMLSAEDLWNNLPKLVRGDNKWNIFAINNSDNIRTSAINDFCLKNGKAKRGSVTKDEFRIGTLLGYWDRQTTNTSVLKDDSRNLKALRWTEGGSVDTVAFKYLTEKTVADLIAKSTK